jgi:8-amino-7-oxononanoate synthase
MGSLMQLQSPLGSRMKVNGREVDYFCGTSYHCLHGHPDVITAACEATRTYGMGPGTRANFPVYEELTDQLCGFFGVEAVTYAISGYVSPLIVLQGVRDDYNRVFVDAAAHYSICDALGTLRRPVHPFRHLDPQDLADVLARELLPGEVPMVVTDGVFPSTGVLAPLVEICAVMDGYDGALLCVDDSHGVGSIGATGQGAIEFAGVAGVGRYLAGTTSKAFGGAGGFVPGSRALADKINDKVRLLSGASPPPPASAAAAAAGIALLRGNTEMLARLSKNVQRMRSGLRGLGLDIVDSPVPIVSVAADTDLEAVRVGLEKESIMVSRVPPGGYSDAPDHETLRIATFSTHAPDQIDRLVGVMGRLL